MLYFIPAWYQQNKWCENEQYWYSRRMHTEIDDTVKHILLILVLFIYRMLIKFLLKGGLIGINNFSLPKWLMTI